MLSGAPPLPENRERILLSPGLKVSGWGGKTIQINSLIVSIRCQVYLF